MSVGKNRGRDYWEAHLEAIAREGIGATAYARREGLAVSNLYYWRRRLKAQCHGAQKLARNPSLSAPARLFVPVSLGADHSSAGRYVLILGSSLRLELNLFGDALFVFTNRQRSRIKILYWHRNGFCLWQKRLEKERFAWPGASGEATVSLSPKELEWLLEGFDLWANYPHKTLEYQSVA